MKTQAKTTLAILAGAAAVLASCSRPLPAPNVSSLRLAAAPPEIRQTLEYKPMPLLEWMGIRIGMSPAEVSELLKPRHSRMQGCRNEYGIHWCLLMAQVPIGKVSFIDGKLITIDELLNIGPRRESESFTSYGMALVQKYGVPHGSELENWRNGYGATWSTQRVWWSDGVNFLVLHEHHEVDIRPYRDPGYTPEGAAVVLYRSAPGVSLPVI